MPRRGLKRTRKRNERRRKVQKSLKLTRQQKDYTTGASGLNKPTSAENSRFEKESDDSESGSSEEISDDDSDESCNDSDDKVSSRKTGDNKTDEYDGKARSDDGSSEESSDGSSDESSDESSEESSEKSSDESSEDSSDESNDEEESTHKSNENDSSPDNTDISEESVIDSLKCTPVRVHNSRLVLGTIECANPGYYKPTIPPFPFVKQPELKRETRPQFRTLSIKELNSNAKTNNGKEASEYLLNTDVELSLLRRGDIIKITQLALSPSGPTQNTIICLVHDNTITPTKSRLIYQMEYKCIEKAESKASSSGSPSFIEASNNGLYLNCQGKYKSYVNYGFEVVEYDDSVEESGQTAYLLRRNHIVYPSSWFEIC